MVCLRLFSQLYFFGLDKISDVRAFSDFAAGSQMRVGPQNCPSCNASAVEDASWPDHNAICDLRILHHRIRSDSAIRTDSSLAEQLHERLDGCVCSDFDLRVNHTTRRIEDGHAVGHQLAAFLHSHFLIEFD